jgi:predicted HAD superfamily phosphohydrolase YqeG
MDVGKIVAEIDAKIASLQQARAVLVDLDETSVASKPRRGRPKGSTSAVKSAVKKPAKRKRNLTPEGRKRIADAMRRRWAERRKEAAKPAKKVAAKKEAAAKK